MNGNLTIHPKTAATAIGGAIGLFILWLLNQQGVNVTPEEAGALIAALGSLGAWLAPIATTETLALTKHLPPGVIAELEPIAAEGEAALETTVAKRTKKVTGTTEVASTPPLAPKTT